MSTGNRDSDRRDFLRGATLRFAAPLPKKRLGPKDRLRIRTDHQGRFDVEGLPPGTYELEFGHREGTRQEQTLDLQSDHYNLLVNLQPRPAQPK